VNKFKTDSEIYKIIKDYVFEKGNYGIYYINRHFNKYESKFIEWKYESSKYIYNIDKPTLEICKLLEADHASIETEQCISQYNPIGDDLSNNKYGDWCISLTKYITFSWELRINNIQIQAKLFNEYEKKVIDFFINRYLSRLSEINKEKEQTKKQQERDYLCNFISDIM